jgi:hypothetical protein
LQVWFAWKADRALILNSTAKTTACQHVLGKICFKN